MNVLVCVCDLFVDFGGGGGCTLVSGIQNDMVAYILDHAVCFASAASLGRSLYLSISQLRAKYSSSNCPNHVWQKIKVQLRNKL